MFFIVCENRALFLGVVDLSGSRLPQITDLRQRLAESQKTVLELEAEREQRQRDYDKKLLLAKSKIENVQVRMQRRKAGLTDSEF